MRKSLLLALVLGWTILAARPSEACMIVGAGDPPAKVSGEEVLIVWDAKTQTEQMVRHLAFSDAAHDFGFVVPTPARPALDEADDAIFAGLYQVYRRRVPSTKAHELTNGPPSAAKALAAHPVQEIEHKRVAGLDATVLLASDASALSDWLANHHYETTAAMTDYLRPYVAQGWYLTAFRYDPAHQDAPSLHTRAVKLTFHSERPFFPYAEPADAPHVWGRAFRVTVIAPQRVRGEVDGKPWGTFASYAGKLRKGWAQSVKEAPEAKRDAKDKAGWDEVVKMSPVGSWMTTFDERVEARGGSDLFFIADPKEQGPARSGLEDVIE